LDLAVAAKKELVEEVLAAKKQKSGLGQNGIEGGPGGGGLRLKEILANSKALSIAAQTTFEAVLGCSSLTERHPNYNRTHQLFRCSSPCR